MLGGIIALYLATGATTFDMIAIAAEAPRAAAGVADRRSSSRSPCALAVKVPIFPFHTWLPDAHVEAPTAVSVLLAGVLLKMGSLRLPEARAAACCPRASRRSLRSSPCSPSSRSSTARRVALVQTDLKKLVAYSSVSHMGYVMLGIAAGTTAGVTGASVQMFSHGLIAGLLFLLVGAVYERAHTREIAAFGGIAKVAPVLAGTLVFASFASLGLPGLSAGSSASSWCCWARSSRSTGG